MALDPQRTHQLHAAKLKALVAGALGEESAGALGRITGTDVGAFAVLGGLGVDGLGVDGLGVGDSDVDGSGCVAAYLAEVKPASGLGPALAAATRAGAEELHVFVDDDRPATERSVSERSVSERSVSEGSVDVECSVSERSADAVRPAVSDAVAVLTRRAALFNFPITVWAADGTNVQAIQTDCQSVQTDCQSVQAGSQSAQIVQAAQTAAPQARMVEPPPPRVPDLVALLRESGVDVSVEHGVITGEVQGLEIARVVPADPNELADPSEPADPNELADPSEPAESGSWRIEVGVGANDREAFGMLHANEPTPDAVRRIAEVVRLHRSLGAQPHPLNRMAAERWLRALLLERPDLVGAKRLTAASPPVARSGVADKSPAVSYGVDDAGRSLVVVASVGIDLDLVPFAADARAFLDPGAQLVLVVPQRDAHPLLYQLTNRLRDTGVAVALTPDVAASVALPSDAPAQARIVTVPDDWAQFASPTPAGVPTPGV